MNLSIGIVGLPNVGKSTLFNALTKKEVAAENYPFCTIDPSVGIVPVPDARLDALSKWSNTQKTIPAVVEFVDIAGLVEGASKGEGLGNKFLATIREVDAILHMVRTFSLETKSGDTINHVYGSIDPLRDIQVIMMELILADLETVEKRMNTIARDVKRGDDEAVLLNGALVKLQAALSEEKLARSVDLSEDEMFTAKTLHLLTMKRVLYSLNMSSNADNLIDTDPVKFKELTDFIEAQGNHFVVVDAVMEADLKDFEGEEKTEMRGELGGSIDGVDALIQGAYKLLGLQSFFTTGEKETRAWTIKSGWTAPQAGSAIHNDFEAKFIRADIVNCSDLLECDTWGEARTNATMQTVGKDYVMSEGDVVEFKVSP